MIWGFVAAAVIVWAVSTSKSRILQALYKRFGECGFCFGVWVFFALSPLMNVNFLGEYIPVVTELIQSIIFSFALYLMRLGWESQQTVVYTNDNS